MSKADLILRLKFGSLLQKGCEMAYTLKPPDGGPVTVESKDRAEQLKSRGYEEVHEPKRESRSSRKSEDKE